MEFNFFLIDTFYIDPNQSCDIATFALRKFLHGERIKGDDDGFWLNSSVAYALWADGAPDDEGGEQGVGTGKRKREDGSTVNESYHEVIPFLRNGFFQDSAIIRGKPDNARILVGARAHFEKDLLSVAEAKTKADRLVMAGSSKRKMNSHDTDILNLVRNFIEDESGRQHLAAIQGVSSAMIGLQQYKPSTDGSSDEQLRGLKQQIQQLQAGGGSVAGSGALHALRVR